MVDLPHTAGSVVSDTSPLISLASVGLLHLLNDLYHEVLVPAAVRDEYEIGRRSAEPTLESVDWITVSHLTPDSPLPAVLDPGESATIALAVQTGTRAVLLDERLGRRAAAQLGLPVVGTLGVLPRAKQTGLLELVKPTVDDMIAQGIRIGSVVRSRVLRLAEEEP